MSIAIELKKNKGAQSASSEPINKLFLSHGGLTLRIKKTIDLQNIQNIRDRSIAFQYRDELVKVRPKKVSERKCLTERQEHIICADWLRAQNIFFHHSPNGEKRHVHTGFLLKRMGVKPGWPDFEIPCPKNGHHGLFIELKATDGILSPNQKIILDKLNENGYLAVCTYGFEQFKKVVQDYFL